MLTFCNRNAGQNHNIKIAKRTFENMAKLKYFGTTAANQNLIPEEIRSELNSGNAYYHSVQNLLSFEVTYLATCPNKRCLAFEPRLVSNICFTTCVFTH
jgi:hypothetical protein